MKRWLLILLLLFSSHPFWTQNNFFIQNKGQVVNQNGVVNKDLHYKLNCGEYTVSFYDDYFAYEILTPIDSLKSTVNRVEIWFLNGNNQSILKGVKKQKDVLNFYKNGNSFTNIPLYEKIKYTNVWEGVDIEFSVYENALKYDYVIRENAKQMPQVEVKGAVPIVKEGNIELDYSKGVIIEKIPFVYEVVGSKKNDYEFLNIEVENQNILYKLPSYRENTVIIDPIAYGKQYSTYYGGSNTDYLYSIDNNMSKEVVVGGFTFSSNNIATTGAYQTTISDFDVFIAKFDSLGNRQWGTYFGGNDFDRCYAIRCDHNDNIIVTGNTMSITGIATTGAFQTTLASTDDAFIAKFNNSGQLLWSTYYGGNNHDFVADVDIDVANNIYLTGHTGSSNLVISSTAHNAVLDGTQSSFIAAFDGSGSLIHSSYYGFGTFEEGHGIKWANDGSIYMTGVTASTSEIAYGVSYSPSFQGVEDAFLVKFSSSFQPIWGTYIGGAGQDQALDVALDDSLNAYIIGVTSSTSQIASVNAEQPNINSNEDGFIVKLDSSGQRVWGTYYGGEAPDYLTALAIKNNNLWITGYTFSTTQISDSTSINQINNGAYDNVILHFDRAGNRLWSTYLGGSTYDYAQGIIIIDSTNVAICGYTNSVSNITTSNAFQITHAGGYDGFWTKICKPLRLSSTSLVGDFTLCEGDSLIVNSVNTFPNYSWSNGNTASSIVLNTTGKYWLTTLDENNCPGRSDTIRLDVIPRNDVNINSSGNLICPEDSVSISVANTFDSYSWNNNDTTFQQFVSDSGLYWLNAIDSLECTHVSDTFNLEFSQTLYNLGVIGSTTLCQGGSAILYLSSPLSNIIWNNGVTSPSQSVDSSGVFWMSAINAQACTVYSDTVAVTLVGYQNPVAALDTAGVFELCNGDTLLLEADTGFVLYNWSNGTTGSFLNVDAAGQYFVVTTDTNGCTAISDTALVTVLQSESYFVGTLNGDKFCQGDSILVFTGDSLVNVNWSNGMSQNSIYLFSEVQVFYTAIDSLGCEITSDIVLFSYYPVETPILSNMNSDSVFCESDSLYFTVQPQVFTSYLWNNSDTAAISTQVFSFSGIYVVDVAIVDSNACFYDVSTDVVIENCSNIDEIEVALVMVYPNPVKNKLGIVAQKKIKAILLYDMRGKLAFRKDVTDNQETIFLPELTNQLYLLKIIFKDSSVYQSKIAIEH